MTALTFSRRIAAMIAAAALTIPVGVATADTSSDPSGSATYGSSQNFLQGKVGLGEFNKSVTSSWNLADRPAPTGGARVLVFGDSHTGGTTAPLYADSRGCMHSRSSWPNQLEGMLGSDSVVDASCWGSGLNSGHGIPFADQVRYAESLGGIGPNTTDIVIQLGFNDAWSGHGTTILESTITCLTDRGACGAQGIAEGRVINPADVTVESYVERAKPVIDYLRYYAPNARIHALGYGTLVEPTDTALCVTIGSAQVPVRGTGVLADYFRTIARVQKAAAARLKLDFIDYTAATDQAASCSGAPLINGVGDTRGDILGVPWHPTTAGNARAAHMVRDRLSVPAAE